MACKGNIQVERWNGLG